MSVRINLEIGHEASIRTKRTLEGFTHDWEVFVRGCDGAEVNQYIEKVVFHLHETFPKPKRVIKEPPYSVKESGYAGFNFPIDIYLKNKDEPKKIKFNYDLHLQPTGPAIKKVQQEKYIFNNPSEDFKQKLLRGGAVIVSSSSSQDSLDLKSSIDDKYQLLNKPKLGGSDMVKKHKLKPEEHKGSGVFTDVFGPPIQKTSKISPDSKSKDPKDLNKGSTSSNKEKGSEKEKNKKSPLKDKDKDRDRDRLKDKADSDRKIKEKEKSKERIKERERSKEKSSKRDKSPRPKSSSPKRSSPKRLPSPKTHQSPVPKVEEKRTESSKERKPDDPKTDKKYKKEKRDKDKEKEYSDKYKESNKNDYKEHKKELKPKEVSREKEPSPLPPPKIEKKDKSKESPKETPKEIPEIPPEKVKEKTEEKKEKHKHKKKDKEKRDKKDKEDRDKSHKSDKKSDKTNNKYEPPKPVEVDKSSLFASVKHESEPKPPVKPTKPLNALFSEIENDNSNSSISSKEEPPCVESLPPPPPPPPVKPDTKTESLFDPKIEPEKVKVKKEKNKKKDKKSEKEEKKRKRKLEAKPEEEPETKIFKDETFSDGEQTTTSQSKDLDKENQENPEEYMRILRELQHKIMTLQDNTELQKVVQLIAETGRYEVSARTFDFDLCLLERSTVRRLQEFFSISS